MTSLQKKTAQAIVNIFETSRVLGDYAQVTLLPGDPGHLTYGRSQTTLASGNLHLLIKAYVQEPDAAFAAQLAAFLDRLEGRDLTLDHDAGFRFLLEDAGADPVMMAVQDDFFDRVYWNPSEQAAKALGIKTALGGTVVYDSNIHGSWRLIRDRTTQKHGEPKTIGEQPWIEAYVAERDAWLRHHSIRLLRRTVYRMEEFAKLMKAKKWSLPLPLTVRGIAITRAILEQAPPIRVSAEGEEQRLLRFELPMLTGDDVADVQKALERKGFNLQTHGIFDRDTEAAVRRFQETEGLVVDGIVGPATRGALGI